MDFVSDQLYDGKRFRVLTLIDLYTRECLATYADKAIKEEGVCAILRHERSYIWGKYHIS